jgi:hypothetical protein
VNEKVWASVMKSVSLELFWLKNLCKFVQNNLEIRSIQFLQMRKIVSSLSLIIFQKELVKELLLDMERRKTYCKLNCQKLLQQMLITFIKILFFSIKRKIQAVLSLNNQKEIR